MKRISHTLLLSPLSAVLLGWSSFSPWLHDPSGLPILPWQVPLDFGWRFPPLTYGLLCSACLLLAIVPALQSFHLSGALAISIRPALLGLCCLFPLFFFLLQFLCYDLSTLDHLAQHEQQTLLVQNLFFYPLADQIFPLHPFTFPISTLANRIQLIVDQAGYGLLLPLLACLLLLSCAYDSRNLKTAQRPITIPVRQGRRAYLVLASLAFCLLLALIRACLGLFCEQQGRSALLIGAYAQALTSLNYARMFLPALDAVAFYHLERGEALYYLSPERPDPEAQAYLAATYRSQQDFASAEKLEALLLDHSPSSPWIRSELSETLESWIVSREPLKASVNWQPARAVAVLPQLQELEQVDPTNIYAWYLTGRVAYTLHQYRASQPPLYAVLRFCQEPAILSSVYTYLALGESGLDNPANARLLLLKAVSFDPGYRNNTAREALSGLH